MARILIIDDDHQMCGLLEQLFSKPENAVFVAHDGTQGLKLAKESAPDVVILDLVMPGMDGHQVCASLRSDPATSRVPILMLTAVHELPAAMKGMASGANDFVTKPFQPDDVLARVDALMRRSHL